MGKTIGFISIKGGVGKTSVAASVAASLARDFDKKVLLVDANYSAPNLGLHMGIIEPRNTVHDVLAGKARMASAVHEAYGVDVIPGSYTDKRNLNYLKLKDRLKRVKEDYDFVVIDSSPSLNEEILSTILACDNLFVVATPDYPTLYCSLRAANLAKQRGKPISGIVLNKIRNPKYELKLEDMEDATDIPVVARLPDDKNGVKALFNKMPISVYNRRSPIMFI